MNKELKLCPFCGGEASVYWECGYWYVICNGCSTKTPYKDSKGDAFKAWNTRKPIDKVVEQLENLETYKQTVTMEKHLFCASEIETVSKKRLLKS